MGDEKEIAPGELLKRRYIPIEEAPEKLGVSVRRIQNLINSRKIRYAEFIKPGAYKRSVHIDPVEVRKVLKIKEVKLDE